MSSNRTPRSLEVASARIGSVLARILAARWRCPRAVAFTNQRSLIVREGGGSGGRRGGLR